MKNKGFTLIELLGVIVIISIILLITFPTILSIVKDKNSELDDATKKLVYNAADLVVRENDDIYIKEEDATYCITINELIDYGYLVDNVNINDEDIRNTKAVEVIYNTVNNNYGYYNNQFGFDIIELDFCNLIKTKNDFIKCEDDNKCTSTCVSLSYLKSNGYISNIYDNNTITSYSYDSINDKLILNSECSG